MELEREFCNVGYKGVGCLFWAVDKEGEVWVLLGKRRYKRLIGSSFHYSIPDGEVLASDKSDLDGAMRVGYEEFGILDNPHKAELFWNGEAGSISIKLYSLRLSTKVPPKQLKSCISAEWFRLGDNIEDLDTLTQSQLCLFKRHIEEKALRIG